MQTQSFDIESLNHLKLRFRNLQNIYGRRLYDPERFSAMSSATV